MRKFKRQSKQIHTVNTNRSFTLISIVLNLPISIDLVKTVDETCLYSYNENFAFKTIAEGFFRIHHMFERIRGKIYR